jgi:hypothetical protein
MKTKRHNQPRRIRTLEGLYRCALRRKAVTVSGLYERKPAAFIMSMQAGIVLQYIRRGMFEYRKNAANQGLPRERQ